MTVKMKAKMIMRMRKLSYPLVLAVPLICGWLYTTTMKLLAEYWVPKTYWARISVSHIVTLIAVLQIVVWWNWGSLLRTRGEPLFKNLILTHSVYMVACVIMFIRHADFMRYVPLLSEAADCYCIGMLAPGAIGLMPVAYKITAQVTKDSACITSMVSAANVFVLGYYWRNIKRFIQKRKGACCSRAETG